LSDAQLQQTNVNILQGELDHVRASVLLKGEKEAREHKRECMRVAAKIAYTNVSQHDNVVHVWVEGWLGWVKGWARDEVSTTT
jgi:hypothetical protein